MKTIFGVNIVLSLVSLAALGGMLLSPGKNVVIWQMFFAGIAVTALISATIARLHTRLYGGDK